MQIIPSVGKRNYKGLPRLIRFFEHLIIYRFSIKQAIVASKFQPVFSFAIEFDEKK